MNKCILVGRLTKDPETRVNGDVIVTRFSIAVDRKYKKDGEPTADFLNCVSFNKTAEFINRYFAKGRRIGIEGHIQTGKYTKQDGTTVYTTDIIVDGAEFVDSKNESSNDNSSAQAPAQTSSKASSDDGFMKIDDSWEEELPFN